MGAAALIAMATSLTVVGGQGNSVGNREDGKRVFDQETFGGNGRTCLTCHSRETGTVSPEEAQARFKKNPSDPLFVHDGSDDFQGHGVSRILKDATILVEIPLPSNVTLADDPTARSVVLRRGIPTTLNTPALDPVLMYDGREPNLISQAAGAIKAHYQATRIPDAKDLRRIAEFQLTDVFFSSDALRNYARGNALAPGLPEGVTESEKRGRVFFEDKPVNPFLGEKQGLCALCHSGPRLDATNQFLFGLPPGSRFQSVGVSEINAAQNPVRKFVFKNKNGSITEVVSPDPGRALISGVAQDFPFFDHVNAFKIPTLRGVRKTAPYFHDNSAKTLEAVAAHYALFFAIITDPDGPLGKEPPQLILTKQDQDDMVAYMKLLD